MEEIQVKFMFMLIITVFHKKHAKLILLKTLPSSVVQIFKDVKTVLHQLELSQEMKEIVGLKRTTLSGR